MRGAVRWIGAPGMAAMLALPLFWMTATPADVHHDHAGARSARAHSAHAPLAHARPAPKRAGHKRAEHRPAGRLGTRHQVAGGSVGGSPPAGNTIAGRWLFLFGDFEFRYSGGRTFTDDVISQRPGVACPKVNDQDGQVLLRQSAAHPLIYTGTWEWFNPASCASAGFGRISIQLWRTKPFANVTAYPPAGYGNARQTFRITRLG
jgi:hypothetical protein